MRARLTAALCAVVLLGTVGTASGQDQQARFCAEVAKDPQFAVAVFPAFVERFCVER
jgi:hypothetical protein